MMGRSGLAIVLIGFVWTASPVAQEPTPFAWDAHQAIPQRISDAAVGVNLTLDAIHAFRATDHAERWEFLCRTGLTAGLAEGLKLVLHRDRPDHSDRKSTPSEHTAFATAAAGYRPALGASLALTVAWGRQAGGKHFASDVAFGAALGGFSRWLCGSLIPSQLQP